MIIKPLETTEEIRGKAFVHCTAWKEAYAGIVDQSFLDGRTLELSESFARRAFDLGYASLIAVDDGKVCGFADYGPYRGDDLPDAGEVYAIYVLKDHYGSGAGPALMSKALESMPEARDVAVWVLKDNHRAIRFYTRFGFRPDGEERTLKLGTEVREIRMILSVR